MHSLSSASHWHQRLVRMLLFVVALAVLSGPVGPLYAEDVTPVVALETVPAEVPPAPVLLSPADGSAINTLIPLLKVDHQPGGVGMKTEVHLSTNPSFDIYSTWRLGACVSNRYVEHWLAANLQANARYYWRARTAIAPCSNLSPEYGPWSKVSTFTTTSGSIPPAPTPITPPNNAVLSTLRPRWSWMSAPDQLGYQMEYWDVTANQVGGPLRWNNTDRSFTPSWDLVAGHRYKWVIQVRNSYAWSPESETWYFTIADAGGGVGAWLREPVTGQVRALSFLSATDGWAAAGPTMQHWDGASWSMSPLPPGASAIDVSGVSATDAWALGSSLLHWDGAAWSEVPAPPETTWRGIDMVSATDGWGVGEQGAIMHWDGTTWNVADSPITDPSLSLRAVDMLSATDGWIVGGGSGPNGPSVILHWDGHNWTEVPCPADNQLRAVKMLSPKSGWASGNGGALLRWDGVKWSNFASPTRSGIYALSPVSESNVWIGDLNGRIYQWNGAEWLPERSPTTGSLWDLAMVSAKQGWVGAEDGLLRRMTVKSSLSVPAVMR